MSAEKRPAAESLGSAQLVKRQKSDASMSGNQSIAVVNGNAQNGALIQAVCMSTPSSSRKPELNAMSTEDGRLIL
jgi:Prp8 binding protein